MKSLTYVVTFFVLVLSIFLFGGCGEPLNDPETIGGGIYEEDVYYIDKDVVYYVSSVPLKDQKKIIEGADPDSFEVIGEGYSKDKNSAYWIDELIGNSDPATFVVLENGFEKDKDSVFYRGSVLEEADSDTFEIIDGIGYVNCHGYGKDKNAVWKSSSKISGRDPDTFELIDRECIFSKDKNGVYLLDEKLENIDPEIFEFLGNGYVRYEDTIYHSHDPRETYAMPGPNYKLFEVEGADASTFEPLMNLYARDKNNIYYGGLVIDEEELLEEHEEFAQLIGYSREGLDAITVLQKFYKWDEKILSKALQIEFDYPEIFESCIEKEVNFSKIEPIYDEVPNGYSLGINCGRWNFLIDAITDDYQVYEAHGVPYSYYPTHDELFELCSYQEAHCKYYTIQNDNDEEVNIYIMDHHWQWDPGESYIISTYIPLNNDSHYHTARISMKIGKLPEYSDDNYSEKVEEYLETVVNKELKEEDAERIRIFEDILSSI